MARLNIKDSYLREIQHLNLPLTNLKGIGPRKASLLGQKGLHTILDLLFHTPIRYEDRTRISPANQTDAGIPVRLTDTLPTYLGYLGPLTYNNGSGGYASGAVTWTGTVLTGTPAFINWAVQVASDVPYSITITNTATISDTYDLFQSGPAFISIPPARVYLPTVVRQYP